jgi:hypothetical protein
MKSRLEFLAIGVVLLMACGHDRRGDRMASAGRSPAGGQPAQAATAIPAGGFGVAVTNEMPHPMDFFYTDRDSGDVRGLGAVQGHATKVFVIDAPARATITIIERGPEMPGFVASRAVTLKKDSIAAVSLWSPSD